MLTCAALLLQSRLHPFHRSGKDPSAWQSNLAMLATMWSTAPTRLSVTQCDRHDPWTLVPTLFAYFDCVQTPTPSCEIRSERNVGCGYWYSCNEQATHAVSDDSCSSLHSFACRDIPAAPRLINAGSVAMMVYPVKSMAAVQASRQTGQQQQQSVQDARLYHGLKLKVLLLAIDA